MKIRTPFVLLLLLGLALLFACSSSETPSESPASVPSAAPEAPASFGADTTEPAEPVTPDETEPPAAETEVPETAPAVAQPEEGATAFLGAARALDQLASYRYVTSFTFVGEEDGSPEAGSFEIRGAVVGPDRQHITWTDLEQGAVFELIQVESRAWILEDETWQEIPVLVAEAMTQAILVLAPAASWDGLLGQLEATSSYVGQEVVHGIVTTHYTSSARQWPAAWQGEISSATADVWVAEAGYPMRYDFSATGISSDGTRGAATWTMELSDINTPFAIEPPL